MVKQDYIHTDRNGYKLRVVALEPNKPERILLIPPLVGATGSLAIRTFRYFFRKGCTLMSFDYCGHYHDIDNKFTVNGTFTDTEVALAHASDQAKKAKIPLHTVGVCYGLIPLVHVLNKSGWPREVCSMFSVSGLLNMDDLLNFDNYRAHLSKRGMSFKSKSEFIDYMSSNKKETINRKQVFVSALTEYLMKIFAELSEIISDDRFGVLEYSRAEFYESFYEFATVTLPKIVTPSYFPCLFFTGVFDTVFNLQTQANKDKYLKQIKTIVPHAKICNIKIDHFGRGEDHYIIGQEGMKFLRKNEKV
ncbi:MAG: hypothetical protein NG740_06750 [Omnitrophica bacterium]|nr:hypothetical protein [Candidatus Omnitrophota bacterium]